jgi:hypothetical protein
MPTVTSRANTTSLTRPCSSFVQTATSVSPRSAVFDTGVLVRDLKATFR